ncbi:unnamed protein product [Cladocopium goreaui]|uniref:Apple domain-containing protein n=1 Tax=Cladocopium goreaui TaxID=2562237 RepID=A0A9P1CNU7_9DINO|nr:unnamed protein product [Cladocopium goreaui]
MLLSPRVGSDTEGEGGEGDRRVTQPWFSRNVALLLGCCCLMLVALLSRGRHGLRSSPRDLVELVEGCFMQGMYYADPHMMLSTDRSEFASAADCQRHCASVKGCKHFTYWPDGGCLLTDESSSLKAVAFEFSGTMVGPPSCHREGIVKALPALHLANPKAVVPGINGTECSNYPACKAAGITEGHCCPNEKQIALGCCDGFPLSQLFSA